MMSAEGPLLGAVIARMAEPKFNLAAYGVTFSVALFVGAPALMIMAAATTLVRDRDSFLKMRRFTYALNGLITSVMLLVVIPPLFFYIAEKLIKLPHDVARLTHTACLIMIPWPAAVGYRRFYQGVLIRNNRTRCVAYGTGVRLTSVALTALLLYLFFPLEGASVGAASLTAGVIMEAVASRLMARKVVRGVLEEEGSPPHFLGYGSIIAFYLPLALTTIIALGGRPIVTFLVGQSRMAIESLAVLPVVQGLIFLFSCFGLSYQEVVIALAGDSLGNYKPLRNLALALGTLTMFGLGLIGFTPLSGIWFLKVSGLSVELASFAVLPIQILTPIPGLWVLICFERAILMNSKNTGPISRSTAVEVGIIMVTLFMFIRYLDAVGAVAAAIAILIGAVSAPSYLFPPFLKALRERN
jgi:Na+-driven multidrug efflux pump